MTHMMCDVCKNTNLNFRADASWDGRKMIVDDWDCDPYCNDCDCEVDYTEVTDEELEEFQRIRDEEEEEEEEEEEDNGDSEDDETYVELDSEGNPVVKLTSAYVERLLSGMPAPTEDAPAEEKKITSTATSSAHAFELAVLQEMFPNGEVRIFGDEMQITHFGVTTTISMPKSATS